MQKPERQVYESPLQGRKLATPKTIRERIKKEKDKVSRYTFFDFWLSGIVWFYGIVWFASSLALITYMGVTK